MLTIGLFFAGLLVYALVSRLLDRASISAQIVMLVIGVGLGVAAKGTPEATFDTEILGIAGELALILALVGDQPARSGHRGCPPGADRRGARSRGRQ
jgi:hypothetical protein